MVPKLLISHTILRSQSLMIKCGQLHANLYPLPSPKKKGQLHLLKLKENCTQRKIRNTNMTHHPVWSEVLQKRKFAQLNKTILVLYPSSVHSCVNRSPQAHHWALFLVGLFQSCFSKTHPSLFHYVIPYSLLRPSPRPCITFRIIPISYDEQLLPQSYSPSWCTTYCRLPNKGYSNFWSSDALVLSQRKSKTGKLNPKSSSLIHKIYDSNFLKLLQTESWKTNESFFACNIITSAFIRNYPSLDIMKTTKPCTNPTRNVHKKETPSK